MYAAKKEHPHLPEVEQKILATHHKQLLLRAFGTSENALAYLERYEDACIKGKIKSKQIISDACSFDLPAENEEWNEMKWQKLVAANKPNGPNDNIMRLLPLAGKIEQRLKDSEEIEKIIKPIIEEELKKELIKEYRALREDMQNKTSEQWVSEKMQSKLKREKNPETSDLILEDILKNELKTYQEIKEKDEEEYLNIKTQLLLSSAITSKLDQILTLAPETPIDLINEVANQCLYPHEEKYPEATNDTFIPSIIIENKNILPGDQQLKAPNSPLPILRKLDEKESKEWCDFCVVKGLDWKKVKTKYGLIFSLTDDEMEKRTKLSKEWMKIQLSSVITTEGQVKFEHLLGEVNIDLPVKWLGFSTGKSLLTCVVNEEMNVVNRWKIVKTLFDNGANIFDDPNNLHLILLSKDWFLPSYIIRSLASRNKMDFNIRGQYNRTLLYPAVHYQDISLIRYLIEQGTDVNAVDKNGETLLLYIIKRLSKFDAEREEKGKYMNLITYLIEEAHANLNIPDENGVTPLHAAILTPNWTIVRYLITQGADIQAKQEFMGGTPLDFILKSNPPLDVIRYLLDQKEVLKLSEEAIEALLQEQNRMKEQELILGAKSLYIKAQSSWGKQKISRAISQYQSALDLYNKVKNEKSADFNLFLTCAIFEIDYANKAEEVIEKGYEYESLTKLNRKLLFASGIWDFYQALENLPKNLTTKRNEISQQFSDALKNKSKEYIFEAIKQLPLHKQKVLLQVSLIPNSILGIKFFEKRGLFAPGTPDKIKEHLNHIDSLLKKNISTYKK